MKTYELVEAADKSLAVARASILDAADKERSDRRRMESLEAARTAMKDVMAMVEECRRDFELTANPFWGTDKASAFRGEFRA